MLSTLLLSSPADKMDFVSLDENNLGTKIGSISNNMQMLSFAQVLLLSYFILYMFGIFLSLIRRIIIHIIFTSLRKRRSQ